MKIALCLHGIVGNIYTNKQDRVSCGDVDFRIGLEHYKKHLFDLHDEVDVFIHSWSTQYADQIIAAYRPKKHLFEDQIDFKQSSTALNYLKSRWYSTKKVCGLKRAYERENGIQYDWVMLSRFDLALLTDFNLRKYDNQIFYAARHAYEPTIPGEPTCRTNLNDGFCDFWFLSNSTSIDRFSRLYDHWEPYGIFDAHQEAYHHLGQLGIRVGFDWLRGNDFELVRGVYEDCQYAGANFSGIETLKRYDNFPRERFY